MASIQAKFDHMEQVDAQDDVLSFSVSLVK